VSIGSKKTFAIFKNTDAHELAHWFVKLAFKGKRHSFDLGTHIKADAQKRAKEIYLSLHANGWETTLANFAPGVKGGPPTTVGQLCDRFAKTFHGSARTCADYQAVLRRVAGHIGGVASPGKYYGGGEAFAKRLAQINKLKLSIFTSENIEAFRKSFVDAAGGDPLARRSAMTSCNTYMRQLKAMFSKRRLKLLGLMDVSDPTAEIEPFKRADCRYRGDVDAVALFKSALAELTVDTADRGPGSQTEMLKALVLMLCGGLRKNECDKLEWSGVKWDKGQLHIATTKYLHVKSEMGGTVDLDPEILGLLRGWRAAAPDDLFILRSNKKLRLGLARNDYRCSFTFARLADWLRTKGISDAKPLHVLRKAYGSLLNDKFGLHVASLGLRHADIAITAAHYAAKRPQASVGLGGLVAEAAKVVPFQADAQVNTAISGGRRAAADN
jgi:hypothetical protein